ncbi:MAG: CapA family protein [Alistipes onderdonkii]
MALATPCACGVDVAVLASNHCCDGGAAGVHTTVAELGRCGILHTGVFTDSLDRAQQPAAGGALWRAVRAAQLYLRHQRHPGSRRWRST